MSTDDLIRPPQVERLTALIDQKPEALALGDSELRVEALKTTKYLYDLGTSGVKLPCAATSS